MYFIIGVYHFLSVALIYGPLDRIWLHELKCVNSVLSNNNMRKAKINLPILSHRGDILRFPGE